MGEGTIRDEALIGEAVELIPRMGQCFYAAVSRLPQCAGRSLPQMKAMAFLYHQDTDRCTVGDLAHGLNVSMPAASEMVDRMVEDGLLERGVDPADRRRVLIALTPTARALGDHLYALRRAQVASAFARLAPEERQAFVRGLRALIAALDTDPEHLMSETT